MKPNEAEHELLVRYIDGRATPEECRQIAERLRTDPTARAFLRELGEQAVMVADLERIAAGRREALDPRLIRLADQRRTMPRLKLRSWRWGLAAAAGVALLAAVAFRVLPTTKPAIVRVAKVTGSSQYFGSHGRIENMLSAGTSLGAGDTLETLSCDGWIELELRDGSTLTIAGHSTLRVLEAEADGQRFKLQQGSLWVRPAQPRARAGRLFIRTPTAALEVRAAQFDVQTSATETMLRVNEGSARVARLVDGSVAEVPAAHQATVSLSRKDALSVTPQPGPLNHWAGELWQIPEVILGKWLPPTGNERARLGAEPLLWPIPGQDPVMLYAVALAAWKTSERPVLLQSDSRFRFRGRTERAHTVRFGFSTQKMRGVFAGKFEVDVPPASLGPAGEAWEAELPLKNFRPLQPQLSASPEGLELTDIYALTIKEDAGLEIHGIELLPTERTPE